MKSRNLLLEKSPADFSKGHRLSLIAATFITIALLSQINHHVLGSGHESIESALLSMFSDWKTLISLFAFKFIATTISYGSGISGGLFMPTLLLGASLGGFIGSISHMVFPEFSPIIGAFALNWNGFFFCLRYKSTSSLQSSWFLSSPENGNIILPLMISNIISYALSPGAWIKIQSMKVFLSRMVFTYLKKRDYEILDTFVVEEAMVRDVVFLQSSDATSPKVLCRK